MKLIVLYGPPASGKYTLAKDLAEKTGFKLFHNHLTVDLLRSVFEFGTPDFFRLSQMMRLEIFAEAAKQKISGVVFTFVYEKKADNDFIERLSTIVTENGGEAIFIQVYCEKGELLKRVNEESRKQFHKIKSEDQLKEILETKDIVSSIDFVQSVKIDTTRTPAEENVAKILEIIKQTS
jgi:shikimate kinase